MADEPSVWNFVVPLNTIPAEERYDRRPTVAEELASIAKIHGLQNSVNPDYRDRYAAIADAAQPDLKTDFDKAQAVVVKFGLIGFSLVAGWILAKIF